MLIAGRGFAPLPALARVRRTSIFAAAAPCRWSSIALAMAPGWPRAVPRPATWIWILAGGMLGAAIPTTAFVAGIGLIGPSRAAILMTIEPLVGVDVAALLLGEQPTELQLIGGAAVLVGGDRAAGHAHATCRPRWRRPAGLKVGGRAAAAILGAAPWAATARPGARLADRF